MRIEVVVIAIALASTALDGCASKTTTSSSSSSQTATADNSRTSVDWPGTYTGVIPCEDCEGIETSLALYEDGTYLIKTKALGKDDKVTKRTGSFTWDEAGGKIQLQGLGDEPNRYLVGENVLFQLDEQGNRITGDVAAQYTLSKTSGEAAQVPEALLAASSWRLTELMGKPVPPPAEGQSVPSLTFEPQPPNVHGFAGCNNFTGNAEFTPGNRLRFGNLAVTQKACLDMTVETDFVKVLNTADNYVLGDEKLVLQKAKMAPLARFEAVGKK
jgi:copper homeostasis protein (lipoprotein)